MKSAIEVQLLMVIHHLTYLRWDKGVYKNQGILPQRTDKG